MDLQENLRRNKGAMGMQLDLDSFGKIMDEFIEKSRMGLLVTKTENSKKWKVEGVGCGAVMDFYVLLNAMEPIFVRMINEMKASGLGVNVEKTAGAMAEMIRETLIGAGKQAEG